MTMMLLEWPHYPRYVGHCVTAEAYARATSGFAYGVDIGNERIQVFVPSNQSLTISNQ